MTATFQESVVKHHTAILGKTGSGKTSTAKLFVEQVVAAGARVCVLDPIKSDWWGLTSSADGKRPGLPFQILGGPHGHVPLHDGAGAAIGELVGTGALPLSIIDMADFRPGGSSRFFNAFADRLMRKQRGVVYLVIEEAHEFAPKERSGVGDENMAIHYAKKLATAGRSKGIRLIVCSQAVQQLHNRVLGSCETLIVHRFTAPADQAPVLTWLKGNVEDKVEQAAISASLRRLANGEGWICTSGEPLERRQFPRIRTFDNSATPEGDDHRVDVVTSKVDVAKLREVVGEAVREAEADDPKALRAQIANLQRQIEDGKVAPAAFAQRAAEDYEAGKTDGEREGFDRGCAAARDAQRALLSTVRLHTEQLLVDFGKDFGAMLEQHAPHESTERLPPLTPTSPLREPFAPVRQEVAARTRAALTQPAADIGKGEASILSACIEYPSGLTNEQLTMFSGLKRSTRDLYVQRLVRAGLVERNGGLVVATAAGVRALPGRKPLPRGAALREHWMQRLSGGEREIFEILCRANGRPVDRAAVGDAAGLKHSTRDLYLQRLGRREIIEALPRGQVRAAPGLFA